MSKTLTNFGFGYKFNTFLLFILSMVSIIRSASQLPAPFNNKIIVSNDQNAYISALILDDNNIAHITLSLNDSLFYYSYDINSQNLAGPLLITSDGGLVIEMTLINNTPYILWLSQENKDYSYYYTYKNGNSFTNKQLIISGNCGCQMGWLFLHSGGKSYISWVDQSTSIRQNKKKQIYPSQGPIENLSENYLYYISQLENGYMVSTNGVFYQVDPDLNNLQKVLTIGIPPVSGHWWRFQSPDTSLIGSPSIISPFSGIRFIRDDFSYFEVETNSSNNRVRVFTDKIIIIGNKLYPGENIEKNGIMVVDPDTHSMLYDEGIGICYSHNDFNKTSVNANQYAVVGWEQFIAVGNFYSSFVPTILSHPQGQTITSGTSVNLTVSASSTGSDPMNYQWYNGISGDTSIPVGSNAPIFTTPSLTATTSYWVRVSNKYGYVNSNTAAIAVTSLPTITVTSPNGGEELEVGALHQITWITNGYNGNITIEFSTNNGFNWTEIFSGTNNGSYNWTIPNTISSECLIRISEQDGNFADTSNAVFSIIYPPYLIPAIERNVLIDFYNSTNGDEWDDNSGWKTSPLHSDGFALPGTEGAWFGVTINNTEHVIKLDLSANNLSGNIPTSIGNLINLETLQLTDNYLSGTIPIEIENLINLVEFNIKGNQITGPIPADFANLDQLSDNLLDIGYNGLFTEDETLRNFLDNKTPGWETTQTVPPKGVNANPVADGSIDVSWSAIPFTDYPGGYRVLYGTEMGGPYTLFGTTADKTITSMKITGLNVGTTYYFVVQTRTEPHNYNENTVDSVFSEEVNTVPVLIVPTITVISPNGGESLIPGSKQEIIWTSTSTFNKVIIEYSIDGGVSWLNITPSTYNDGNYFWTVPETPSLNCLIRIRGGFSDSAPIDVSDSTFSIATPVSPTLLLTSPNGNENWDVGSTQEITWTGGDSRDVRIDYSIDNGFNWTNIIPSTDNDGLFLWTVPNTPSGNCRVQVSRSDSDIGESDTSDMAFSIVPAEFITVTSPNGREELEVGCPFDIKWLGSETIDNVKIEYSINSGNTWITIVPATANNGNYNWTVPDTPAENCLLRISGVDGGPLDINDVPFSIVPPVSSTIMIISPNGAENLTADSTYPITWTSSGSESDIILDYSIDNGINWINITSSTKNDGSYNWIVPDTPSENCLVRVIETNSDREYLSDISDAVFSIISPSTATIRIITPNGNEKLKSGSNHEINWKITGPNDTENVTIEYSSNGGTSWTNIIASHPANTSYNWTIPDTLSENCLVRISGLPNGEPSDISDATFSIVSPSSNSITITSPNGGEEFIVDNTHEITWTCSDMGSLDSVILEYSIDDRNSWILISNDADNNGGYYWKVPDNPSQNCWIRIRGGDSDESPEDISDSVFSIVSPNDINVKVTSPNGGENLTVDSTHIITWTITGPYENDEVTIEYSTDNGTTWSFISEFTENDGIFDWIVPDTASENCRVRVSGFGTDEIGPSDVSDDVFSINSDNMITVTSPNGGEQWKAGSSYEITWTCNGITGDVNIDLYNNDTFDFFISKAPADSGRLEWKIPANFAIGDDYTILISSGAIEDQSDSNFSIIEKDSNNPDFNNDGNVDILWRNYSNGSNDIWLMNGIIRTSTVTLNAQEDLDWHIAGTGDINNDGNVDILWRRYTDGKNMVWYMNGTTITGNAYLPDETDENYKIVGTGDFNKDGKVDLLWRNDLEDRNMVWFMNGIIRTGIHGVQSMGEESWLIKGTGDFNGDGKTDILWRNISNGANRVWYMDGTTTIGSVQLLQESDLNWRIVSTGDFNGDNQTDILWRRSSNGQNMIWFMDGIVRSGYTFIEPRPDLNWRIVNNGD